ncbi:hypothetical protein ACTD5D_09220 [Nocardia takedensis]|uniref:hypothetical protein n=1 Tax=Nocardia takedensis TaxID=259390 RepID=UPI0002FCD828|nr:hypothetical protein [Nocardia takedensis]
MGDDSADDSGISGPAQAEAADGPPPRHALDPSVESVWLGRRAPERLGRPRVSTMLLIAAFVALFALYLTVH